jgi:hypothetical protein
MVLAVYGTRVSERILAAQASVQERGTHIDELERLARRFHLVAEIQETNPRDLRRILAEGKRPIAYIDRAVFDLTPRERSRHSLRIAKIHTVIPIRVSARSITFHDPRPPRITRKSLRLFRRAHRLLGSYCVVCWEPEE